MELKKILEEYSFPEKIIEKFNQSGIVDLFPPQEEAIKHGVLKGKNLFMSVPTAAGKTLIAELAMLKATLQSAGRCLYIGPLKALVSEKYEDFKKKYSELGIEVG